jgi:cytochrome c oxidase assembly protein subunit 15
VHFLVSMALVWLAVVLVSAVDEGEGPPRPVVPRAVRALTATSTAVLGALLLAGTFVTAAGPHSGDADTPRLAAGVPAMAQLHADLVFGYLGLLVGLGFALRAVCAPAGLLRRYAVLVAAVLLQGAVGGVQYALGVPEALASLHVLGAALVTIAAAAVWTGTAQRGPVQSPPTPPRPGDATPAEAPAPSPDVADQPALAERS